ncbi:MAG: ABC transporter ATP-binding protein [Pirellula sp.]|jgi:lipopolysaccharide transport system ATP-binding protein
MSPIITVSNLSKAYRIGKKEERADSLMGLIQNTLTAPLRNWKNMQQPAAEGIDREDSLHWALRDVSFSVEEGDALGVIGRNGAGKSTLLKVLSQITEPTSGEVRIRGRVASLLEVGTGFHPELTGRENMYLNGTILGMRKKEIDRKFDEIVGFSGVEKFLDTPIKRYSSGMKVRLAFSIAAHLDPELLIIDEVLAVGDASFQKQCMDRMAEISREGRTILFVSHNLDLVDRLCNRAIVLKKGSLCYSGKMEDAVSFYLTDDSQRKSMRDLTECTRTGDGRARFVKVEILDSSGQEIEYHTYGESIRIAVTIDATCELKDTGLAIVLSSVSGTRVITGWNRETDTLFHFHPGRHRCYCEFEGLQIRPGHDLWISLWMEQGGRVLDSVESVADIQCRANDEETQRLSPDRNQGVIALRQRWGVDTLDCPASKGTAVRP